MSAAFSATSHDVPFLALLHRVLDHGEHRRDRTGTGTISLFGEHLRFDISQRVPLLTTKYVPWKTVIKELLWFLQGNTDAKDLQAQGVHIWDGNSSRSFLDARGLGDLEEGDIGAGYGFQWRHFGEQYKGCGEAYAGFDQIAYIIHQLKHDPFSRRIYLSAWNPAQLDKMALPPCHVSCQFYVSMKGEREKPTLSCHLYQRSADMFLGVPFNIFSYTVLVYILCSICDMRPGELIVSLGDAHIYKDHVPQVKEMLNRQPFVSPRLEVQQKKSLEELDIGDFSVHEYLYHPKLVAQMSV